MTQKQTETVTALATVKIEVPTIDGWTPAMCEPRDMKPGQELVFEAVSLDSLEGPFLIVFSDPESLEVTEAQIGACSLVFGGVLPAVNLIRATHATDLGQRYFALDSGPWLAGMKARITLRNVGKITRRIGVTIFGRNMARVAKPKAEKRASSASEPPTEPDPKPKPEPKPAKQANGESATEAS